MSEFPRDELSQEAILRQQLKECREEIAEWAERLEKLPYIYVGNIDSPFEIIQRLTKGIAYLRSDMLKHISI